MNLAIKKIATDILGLETLETRNSDGLDFHDMGVFEMKEALEAAYEAGRQAAAAEITATIKAS